MHLLKQLSLLSIITGSALAAVECTGRLGACLLSDVQEIREDVDNAGPYINFFAPASTFEFTAGDCELAVTPSDPNQDSSVATSDLITVIDGVINQCLIPGKTAEDRGPGGQDTAVPGTPPSVTFSALVFQQPVGTSAQPGPQPAISAAVPAPSASVASGKRSIPAGSRRARFVLH